MNRLEKANIPVRFRGLKFSSYEENDGNKEARQAAIDYAGNASKARFSGKGLLFVGPPGTGKTMLACILGQNIITTDMSGYSTYFLTLSAFIQTQLRIFELRSAWEKGMDADAYSEWRYFKAGLKELRTDVDFLILDDVGKEHTTSSRFAEDEFDFLLRYRFDQGLPTIMTSNLPVKRWAERYSESMESFIHEAFRIVPLSGADFRKEE